MTDRTNVLFVCSRNQWRSPTAERIYARHPGLAVRSGGTSRNAKRPVAEPDVRWADAIFVMEQKHRDRLAASFPRAMQHRVVHVLDIPDEYRFMDPELIELLEQAITPLLNDEP
ncbi:MAG: phosphotyrosine protein phosphatase [Actinomycetota bacterium]